MGSTTSQSTTEHTFCVVRSIMGNRAEVPITNTQTTKYLVNIVRHVTETNQRPRGEKKRNYSSPRVPFARRSQVSHYLRDSIRLIKEALSKGVVEGVHEGGVGVVGVEDDDEGDEGVNVRHSLEFCTLTAVRTAPIGCPSPRPCPFVRL